MRYLKTFSESQGSYNLTKIDYTTNKPKAILKKKKKLQGELIDDDKLKDAIIPYTAEITGKAGNNDTKIIYQKT